MTKRPAIIAAILLSLLGVLAWYRFGPDAWRNYVVSNETITVDGLERSYRLVVPTRPENPESIPVIFALHGALDTTEQMARGTKLDSLADEHGVMIVYLQGRLLNWPPFLVPENPHHADPDYRFFEALCDLLPSQHGADPNRVYVVGVSQGGVMVNFVTANCSERIAASVCNCGWLPSPLGESPLNTANKCPMLFLVGSRDRQVSPAQVREAHDAFAADGHPTQFHVFEDFGHGWAHKHGVNAMVWDFLSQHRLAGVD